MIIGITIILAGVFTILNYTHISNVVLSIGITMEITIIFYAMFKYNKGIF